eukprot:CAMPEP_0201483714 /NCGR_PEP_ID=MMETSP0151_2-20130828/7902_1 /ASSEMBLY_ACC=CAM_ASM_000257 /TAXON_ID=200890 /ORGANISM="Paramoeba atlantica, Strain 621/1 / CCAP 1560/9" /LENGTH=607 /DNA_ID=CAMNT_0047867001 /DNA_START=75 /DNA_END=1898 /DNA_ORIENTATION=-
MAVRFLHTSMRQSLRRTFLQPQNNVSFRMNRNFTTATTSATTSSDGSMFCFQCSQTDDGTGCRTVGVCGKEPVTASLQDLLVDQLKRLSFVMERQDLSDDVVVDNGKFLTSALFSTLTNVNFDPERIKEYCLEAQKRTDALAPTSSAPLPSTEEGITVELPKEASSMSTDELSKIGEKVGVQTRKIQTDNEDLWSARELITYGLKGTSAYAAHAHELGVSDASTLRELISSMDQISPYGKNVTDLSELLKIALQVGGTNFRVMELLDHAHTSTFGTPEPTKVSCDPVPGKAILVSGHDLSDLSAILKATEGKGVNVYTHGELLPAHSYPELKKYPHLIGNYGGPWQLQRSEFPFFEGPIVLTTNCLMEPHRSYKDRVYTRHAVGFSGVKHVKSASDFDQVVNHALELDGFSTSDCHTTRPTSFLTGFGHSAVLSQAGKILSAIEEGHLNHVFVIGGCDGANEARSYFRDLALLAPKDSVVITLACGKYRFNDKWEQMGDIGGIPRLLDMGQCNDSFGAVKVAAALADALKTDINSLPLSFALSWYEQKAVAVLLSLLNLGVQNIHLGPTLPAFVSPNILQALIDNFSIRPIGNATEDLARFLSKNKE